MTCLISSSSIGAGSSVSACVHCQTPSASMSQRMSSKCTTSHMGGVACCSVYEIGALQPHQLCGCLCLHMSTVSCLIACCARRVSVSNWWVVEHSQPVPLIHIRCPWRCARGATTITLRLLHGGSYRLTVRCGSHVGQHVS